MKPINDKVENGKIFESIFNNTHFLIAYMDNNFNFIKVNRAYAEKHSRDPDFFVGKNQFELYPEGDESIFRNVTETGKPYFAYSKPLNHPVSGISYWDWAIQPVKDDNGEVNSIILSLTDVTEYKRSEEEIQKEQHDFIDEMVERRAAEILVELNRKIEKIEKTNENLKKELKSQKDEEYDNFHIEAFDKQISELKKANENFKEIINAQNPEIEKLYIQVLELKKARNNSERVLSNKLSEINYLNHRITELENDASKKEEIISKRELEIENLNHEIIELEKTGSKSSEIIITQESEIKKINENIAALKDVLNESKELVSVKELEIKNLNHEISELKVLKEDLQELNEELLKQLDDLIKTNEELDKFAETAANELQKPIMVIKSFNNILAKRYRGKIDKDADEFIDYALEAVNSLNKKIIGLLEYSRVESRGKEFKLTETEEILDYAISNINAPLEEDRVKITYDDLPKIMADSGQILQLFQSLLKNSVKFKNPEKNPQIHVSAYLDENNGEYVFSVQDNGIGIEEKDLEKVFNIFEKLNPENGQPGIGIGLPICKKIVGRHGGRIWVESKPEIGSRFYFTIPTES